MVNGLFLPNICTFGRNSFIHMVYVFMFMVTFLSKNWLPQFALPTGKKYVMF